MVLAPRPTIAQGSRSRGSCRRSPRRRRSCRPTRLRRPRRRRDRERTRRDTRCPIDGRIYSSESDLATYFLHDVAKDVAKEGAAHKREESEIAFSEPANFQAWPDVPIHVVVGKDDRFFPT
jgi:hypothetical protein